MVSTWCLLAALVLPADVEMKFLDSGATARAGGYRPIRAEMDGTADDVKVAPEGLNAPKYGKLTLGDKNWLFILDEPDEGPSRLFVDANGDGDLTNDPAAEWATNPQGASTKNNGGAKVDLGDGQLGSLMMYRFDPNDPRRKQLANTLLYYTDFGYELSFDLDGKNFKTFVAGEPTDGARLWVDRDGNGVRSSRLESVVVGQPFNFTGTTYVMAVDGGSVTLEPATTELPIAPMPPNLAIGKPALPFEMTSLDGTDIQFPESFKGKVVMLDFWATWCGPCIAELPNVKAAYEKWHGEGFEVLGISFDRDGMADKVKEFTAKNNMPWQQLYEGKYWSTSIGQMYDVSSIPFVLLVDGDTGEILATTGQLRGPGLTEFIGKVLADKKTD